VDLAPAGRDGHLESAEKAANVVVLGIVIEYLAQQSSLFGTIHDGQHAEGTVI
jgi:hypothetical protein